MPPSLSSKCYGTVMFNVPQRVLLVILIHTAVCSLDINDNIIDTGGSCTLNQWQSDYLTLNFTDSGVEKIPLYFLVMAPYPDCPPFRPSWEGGPAVVPAAIVAKDLINQRDDILRDYKIELVISDSGCNIKMKAVNGLVEKVLHSGRNIVGIIGPGCSEATRVTAPLVTDDQLSLIQIAPSATSPDLTNTTLYPNTFRPIVSALGFIDTYVEFIRLRRYQHVGAIYEARRPFQTTVYTHFRDRVSKEGIKLTSVGLFGGHDHFPFDDFLLNVRVIFVFGSSGFARQILCSAYHENISHPNYQFIFSNRKPINFIRNVSANDVMCNQQQMKEIMKGMIFNDFRLRRRDRIENNTHPGISFDEFLNSYTQVRDRHLKMLKLTNYSFQTGHHSGYFDATWALALSLNNSLPRLEKRGLSLSNYTYQMPEITRVIKEELLSLSFEGMRGRVEFSRETHDCVNSTIIDMYQVMNLNTQVMNLNTSAPDLVGEYNPLLQGSPLRFFRDVLLKQADFDLEYVVPCYSIGVFVVIAAVLLFVMLIICHVAFIIWRQYKTIKASSPRLAHIIFIGCYLAIVGTILYTNTYVFISTKNTKVSLTAHCVALHWVIALINPLVFGTLCVKTWRVYCIFYKYNSWLTEYLNDKILLMVVLLFFALTVALNTLWNTINSWNFEDIQGPNLQAVAVCKTENQLTWTIVITALQGILIVFVVYLAIATRGVHKEEFKETKSINSLLFCLVLLNGVCLPLSFILRQGTVDYWRIVFSYLCFSLWLLGSALLCVVFLILPPLIPLIKDKIRLYYRKTTLPTPV